MPDRVFFVQASASAAASPAADECVVRHERLAIQLFNEVKSRAAAADAEASPAAAEHDSCTQTFCKPEDGGELLVSGGEREREGTENEQNE